jgi:photosystem II stability/assembly factor-like uncharacterized protein
MVGEDMYDGGVIKHTNDGGNTWEEQYAESGNEYQSVCFVDEANGWVAGALGRILHTNDGGIAWDIQSTGTTEYLRDVFFVDQNNGWATGNNGTIIHSTNGGLDWEQQVSGTEKRLWDIHFSDDEHGAAVGDSLTILQTIDGGTCWELKFNGSYGSLSGVFFLDEDYGWAVGNYFDGPCSIILHTADGGSNWESQCIHANTGFYGIWFSNPGHGWIVGDYGTILHTDNGGVIGINEILIQNSKFKIQNYPNPFSDFTNLEYELEHSAHLNLSIYNHLGQQVAVLVEGEQEAGRHQVRWEAGGMPAGIYFFRLTVSGQRSVIGKLVKK